MNRDNKRIAVSVIGVGTMGQHHARIISRNPTVLLSGIFDADPVRASEISGRHNCRVFRSLDQALECSQAVCVASPTTTHLEIGRECLSRGLHVLMEKPLAHSVAGAAELVDLGKKHGVTLMAGHVERYNPAIMKMMEILADTDEEIISVDIRRLAPFDGSRCMDVDVLYDLMIHDIDLALDLAKSSIKNVHAVARPVFSEKNDVAHTLIEFENGVIATLWTGKCSPRKLREITVCTRTRQLIADTLNKKLTLHVAQELNLQADGVCFMGRIEEREIPVPDIEPLRAELDDFISAISGARPPVVNGQRALLAMEALEMVAAKLG